MSAYAARRSSSRAGKVLKSSRALAPIELAISSWRPFIGARQAWGRLNMALAAGEPPPVLPMWLFPWLSYLALSGMLAVLVAMAITPSHVDEFWASMVSIAVVLVAYVVFRRGRIVANLDKKTTTGEVVVQYITGAKQPDGDVVAA